MYCYPVVNENACEAAFAGGDLKRRNTNGQHKRICGSSREDLDRY